MYAARLLSIYREGVRSLLMDRQLRRIELFFGLSYD
jgi:hypothetical protein